MKMPDINTVDDLVRAIQVCAWAFVILILMLVFGGIVGSMLYSVIFVTQPIKTMAPIDQAFTKMLNDIVLIMASSITTVVSMFAVNKGSQALANKLAPTFLPPQPPMGYVPQPMGYAPQYAPPTTSTPNFNWMNFQNPELDEEWRAPPPPTTPPDYIDPAKEEIANERALAKLEAA
jgi:hypothetical protein